MSKQITDCKTRDTLIKDEDKVFLTNTVTAEKKTAD